MCEPATLMTISMGMSAAGGLYSASQENAAGKDQQNYYNAQADIAKMKGDEALKLGAARDTLAQDQGAMDSKIASRNSASLMATQRAIIAANGGGGSATEASIVSDTMDKRTLDQMAIKYNADSKSWEAKTGAAYDKWSADAEANQYTAAGINARRAGAARANATLLNTAGQIAGQAFQYSMYSNPKSVPTS